MPDTFPIRLELRGVPRAEIAQTGATARLRQALADLPYGAVRARLVFTDDNGPKGGRATRCAVTVALPRRAAMHLEETAASPRLALDGVLTKLARRLGRAQGTWRELKRRPKKYYAAARARS